MTWLALQFNTVDMTVIIPWDNMQDTFCLVEEWGTRSSVDITSCGPSTRNCYT